ncbi:MAG: MopE-related protein [Planctomycetota bacterium]|nr:MopE-related protein [Planctomycetota bacterium]
MTQSQRKWTVLGTVASIVASAGMGNAQGLERVSVTSTGGEPDQMCELPVVSGLGNIVVFSSRATNLVPGDTNGVDDLFVRDRVAQTTTRVSVGNAGQQSTLQGANLAFLSDDGRFVLFVASGLDPADTDPQPDVYVRDRTLGTTTLLSTSTAFTHHFPVGISADGRVVATSASSPNQSGELRVVDRLSGLVRTLSNTLPAPGTDAVYVSGGVLSGDGRFLDFKREIYFANGDYAGTIERLDIATGSLSVLMADVYFEQPQQSSFDGRFLLYTEYGVGVMSGTTGLFRLDTQSGEQLRIDVRQLPPPMFGPWWSGPQQASMSADGAYVAFTSDDDGIVPGDTNSWANAFVRIPAQLGALRVDLDSLGQDSGFDSTWVSMSADASLVAFSTWADNLLPGDTNLWQDIYLRGACGPHFPDLDLDGFGDSGAASVAQCLPAPAGWSVNALDCDDGAANVHAFAFDGCDGVDNDCDGTTDEDSSGASYCAPNFSGDLACATTIGASGCLMVSATSGYVVTANNLPSQRPGLLFYGLQSNWASWGGAGNILCISGSRQRLPATSTGGTGTCGGALVIDLAAWLSSNPAALGAPFAGGEVLHLQGWYRDPTAPLGSSLTSAWKVAVSP